MRASKAGASPVYSFGCCNQWPQGKCLCDACLLRIALGLDIFSGNCGPVPCDAVCSLTKGRARVFNPLKSYSAQGCRALPSFSKCFCFLRQPSLSLSSLFPWGSEIDGAYPAWHLGGDLSQKALSGTHFVSTAANVCSPPSHTLGTPGKKQPPANLALGFPDCRRWDRGQEKVFSSA